jgi:hypothetical protein
MSLSDTYSNLLSDGVFDVTGMMSIVQSPLSRSSFLMQRLFVCSRLDTACVHSQTSGCAVTAGLSETR